MTQHPEMPPEQQAVQQKLAQRWQDRSPKEFANQLSAPLFGTSGEWDLPDDVTPKRPLLYLAVGMPDADSLPKQALADAAAATLEKPGDLALRYGFGLGPQAIRDWLAARRCATEGVEVDGDWYQVTNGSSGGIDLIVRSLIDPGDVIICETPTYMGTLHNFRGVKADVRYVPIDEQGMRTDVLASTLAELRSAGKRVKLIYTIATFQNPSGVTLSLERRLQLLELACEYDAIVLDDEAYRDLWFEAPPPPALSALAGGWGVITVGSFSKTVATGIRVGWVHARPELLALFGRMRFGMGQNQFGLRAFGEFLARDEFEPHLERVRHVYQHKRDQLHQALLAEYLDDYMSWTLPGGGFYLWVQLRDDLPLRAFWRTAVEEGIAVNSGAGFTPEGAPDTNHIRIAYPWSPTQDFPEAARRLRLACERVAAGERV